MVPGRPDRRAPSTTTGTSGPTSGPGFARSDGSRVWHPDGDRFYYGYFWEGMPDLNLENPEVTAELGSIGEFWLEEMGVAGFRIDAARHLIEDGRQLENTDATFDWLVDFRDAAEGGQARGARPGRGLGRLLDVGTLCPGRGARPDVRLRARERHDPSLRSGDAGSLRASQREVAELYPPGGLATFLTNHDQDRIIERARTVTSTPRGRPRRSC